MNRRNFFRGAVASLFAFVCSKVLPTQKEPCWHVKAAKQLKIPKIVWDGTNVPYSRDRVAEGVINAHIDQLAMGINPVYVRRKSITEKAYEEIQASDIRVYRSTGKCDLKSLKKEENT